MRTKATLQLILRTMTQLTIVSVKIKGISLSMKMVQDLFSGNRVRVHQALPSEYILKNTVKTRIKMQQRLWKLYQIEL